MYDKLVMLRLSFKVRSETLIHDIAKHMLETYCYFDEVIR